MKKKLLFISNITNKITNFAIPSIEAAQAMNYDVNLAANYANFNDDPQKYGVILNHIDLVRNPLNLKNIIATKQMLSLIKKKDIDVIHCNTPIGGVLGRICGKLRGVKKVIYTAHGFHFYKGAPLLNWLLYYPIERLLAHWTDAIITMNKEDYITATKFKIRNKGKVYFVHGVGVDTNVQKTECDKWAKRQELGLKEDDIVLISMGDLIKRKNYKTTIEAVAKANNPKIHQLICGRGPELENLKTLAKKFEVEAQIHFLGFRTDINELLQIADIFAFSTLQEGLPRSLMEAMTFGLPCVVSEIRGNTDLIEDGKGGFLFKPEDAQKMAVAIKKLADNEELRKTMGAYNEKTVLPYDIENVKKEIREIYQKELARD